MLLFRNADEWWSAEKVASVLRTSTDSAAAELERLGSASLVDVRVAHELLYKYAPVTEELARAVHDTAVAFDERRLALFDVVGARPALRAAREFAAAFKMGNGENG